MNQNRRLTRIGLFAGFLAAASIPAFAQNRAYIALGDSAAYGTGSTMLQGYVGRYDAWLGTVYGTAPKILDIAVPGETSSSILGSQLTNFKNTVASENAAGDTITTISVSIGGNDIVNYLATGPTVAQAQIQIPNILNTVKANATTLLTQVRQLVPNADLILNSYWDIPWFGSTFQQESDIANQDGAPVFQSLAMQFNGRYVDNYHPFLGHETQYVNMNDIHPNDTGYDVIAVDMRGTVVPAPNALPTLFLGALPGAGALLRRRRVSVPASSA